MNCSSGWHSQKQERNDGEVGVIIGVTMLMDVMMAKAMMVVGVGRFIIINDGVRWFRVWF